jgi:hypothetical protein
MKKRNLLLIGIALLFSSILFISCKKEESLIEENGLSRSINDIMPQATLDSLEAYGMPIFKGGTPPELEGQYLSSPNVLVSSNIDEDEVGNKFVNTTITLSEQNNKYLSLKIEKTHGDGNGEAYGGFVSGEGNDFSIFTEIKMYREQDSCLLAQVFSGTIASEAIVDFYESLIMLNNYGNPNGYYIEDGSIRVIYDEDGLSEREGDEKSAQILDKDSASAICKTAH